MAARRSKGTKRAAKPKAALAAEVTPALEALATGKAPSAATLEVGPLLHVGRCTEDVWRFSVGVLIAQCTAPQPFRVEVSGANAKVSAAVPAGDFTDVPGVKGLYYRVFVEVPRTATEQVIEYQLIAADGARIAPLHRGPMTIGPVRVPAKGAIPRLAFFSCNGVMSSSDWAKLEDPELLWKMMREEHDNGPGFHVLVGGGDQVYADGIAERVPELDAYRRSSLEERLKRSPSAAFARTVLQQYVSLYSERWHSARGAGGMFARIPAVFTWDDHEIFDGWGSYDPREQERPFFRQQFAAAARTFDAFQLGGAPVQNAAGAPHRLQHVSFPGDSTDVDLVLLDTRTDRTRDQVMSAAQWTDFKAVLDHIAADGTSRKKPRHLLVVCAVPLVFMRFPPVADFDVEFELKDDLIDQWEYSRRRGERARVIMTLLGHVGRTGAAVTVLSGDVHLGARARIRSGERSHVPDGRVETVIEQITSSGIVFPPPGPLALLAMRLIQDQRPDDLPGVVNTEVVPVSSSTYLRARNWLSITPHDDGELRMHWNTRRGPIQPGVPVRAGASI